ncbi:MAG: BTAD domain-containing putative transcriptional regulator [Jatrophihabitantaceae bacterium]
MQLGILGPVEVREDGGEFVEVAGTRLRCLLARLALDAGRPVGVATLVDAVWGDQPPADEANALQTLVSRLRRALGGATTIGQSAAGYRLAVSREDVDAFRFETLAADGASALRAGEAAGAAGKLRAALALWRGPALSDVGESVTAAATRLNDLRLAALVDRIDADLALGRASSVVSEIEVRASEHPLHERLAGQLVRALATTGRQADALTAYERVRARLADELGVDPSADLQATHLAVLRGELVSAAAAHEGRARRTNLKAQLTSFVGRDDEVARIGKSLEENRLVTLVGPGGAGKTRLAAESVAKIVDTAPDGIWFVELASVTDAADMPQAILGSLGLREAHLLEQRNRISARDATSRLLDALVEKQTVIVLDNCEHLIEASARLADNLLARCPGLRVLTTSREPLGIFGETLFVVPPLGQPAADAPAAQALEYPAVRLFADRVAAVRPDFVLDDDSVATVIEIVRRLDGLPLAIELAAARLRTLPLDEIAVRLSDRFRLLTGGSRTALPRHRTLRAVVEWSWELLTPAERALVERLAVFPSGSTLDSATRVCADAAVPADAVLDTLTSLADKSLLQLSGGGRYRMLETIREYGIERLAERDELRRIRAAHADYFAELVRQAAQRLRTSEQLPWIGRLNDERDNVLAALRFVGDDGDASVALELASGVGWYWMLTGVHSEAAIWLKFALGVPGDADENLRMLVESMLTVNSAAGAEMVDAETLDAGMERLRDLGRRMEDADVERFPLLALMRAVIAMFSGDESLMGRLVDSAVRSADPWVVASALMFRANMAENDGDVTAMRADTHRSLEAFTAIGDRWGLASCLQMAALISTNEGDLDAALAQYLDALRYVGELGAHDDESWLHLRLANVYLRRGQLDRAIESVQRSRELSEAAGSLREATFGRVLLAEIARRTGDIAQARRLCAEALARLQAMPPTHPMQAHGMALTLAIAARHEILDGEITAARARLDTAFAAAVGTRDMPIIAGVGVVVALLAAHDGDPARAAETLGAAARLRGAIDPTAPDIAELTTRLRGELGDAAFETAYERGRQLGRDAAIELLDPR